MYHIIKKKGDILLQHFLILKLFILYTYLSTLNLSKGPGTWEHAHPRQSTNAPGCFHVPLRPCQPSLTSLLAAFSPQLSELLKPQCGSPPYILCSHTAQDRRPGAGCPNPTANWCEGAQLSASGLTSLWASSTSREPPPPPPISLAPHRPHSERGQESNII